MNNSTSLLAGLGIALATTSAIAAAAASTRGHDDPAARPASAAVVQAVSPPRASEDPDPPETPFFTSAKTCLLLGTIGALALIVRRRGVD